jgi:hypothetical protein
MNNMYIICIYAATAMGVLAGFWNYENNLKIMKDFMHVTQNYRRRRSFTYFTKLFTLVKIEFFKRYTQHTQFTCSTDLSLWTSCVSFSMSLSFSLSAARASAASNWYLSI